MKTISWIAVASLVLTARLPANPLTGNWSDWGIDPYSGQWDQDHGTRVFFEDYEKADALGYVGPGWGGQYFDVEAIYVSQNGSNLDYAIVTGFDPDGVHYLGDVYQPGDIFFGVHGGWNAAIELDDGTVFTDVIGMDATFPSSSPWAIDSGTPVGSSVLFKMTDGHPTYFPSVYADCRPDHYLIEGSFDTDLIGGNVKGVHWTMSCGNDVGEGPIPCVPVPEPGTLALLGLGLAGTLRFARRARG